MIATNLTDQAVSDSEPGAAGQPRGPRTQAAAAPQVGPATSAPDATQPPLMTPAGAADTTPSTPAGTPQLTALPGAADSAPMSIGPAPTLDGQRPAAGTDMGISLAAPPADSPVAGPDATTTPGSSPLTATANPLIQAATNPTALTPANTPPSTMPVSPAPSLDGPRPAAGTDTAVSIAGSPAPAPAASASPLVQAATNPTAPLAGTPTGVGVNGLDPNADLRNSSVLPTNAVDRNQLTADRLKNYESQVLPQLQADVRAKTQQAAGMGRIGSGMLRTDVGNLDLAAERDLNQKFSDLTSNATEGSIQDAANNRNEYRTERGYQNGLENQAYDRGVQGVTLNDSLQNSALGRGLAQFNAGNANNPAQMQLLLSQLFGQQAGAASNALSGLVKNTASNNAINGATGGGSQGSGSSDATAGSALDWLKEIGLLGGGQQQTDPAYSPTGTTPIYAKEGL